MSNNNKQTVQDTFNAIASANNHNELKQGLALISNHTADERKEIVEKVETAVRNDFINDIPTPEEFEAFIAFATLVSEGPNEEDLDTLHGNLIILDAIVTEQGQDASADITGILASVANLSDEDYNNPTALMTTVVEAYADSKKTAKTPAPNPLKNKYKPG